MERLNYRFKNNINLLTTTQSKINMKKEYKVLIGIVVLLLVSSFHLINLALLSHQLYGLNIIWFGKKMTSTDLILLMDFCFFLAIILQLSLILFIIRD